MSDLLTTGGAGGIGTILGALGSWLGLKPKIDALEKKIDKVADSVMYEDTCSAKHNGLEKRLESQVDMLKEIRGDIKILIRKK